MASDVGIVNAALAKLGLSPILSFADQRTEARLATATYAELRDAVLRDHPWNFAIVREAVSEDTDTPVWGYAHRYPWPETPHYCLRILDIENTRKLPWKIEGRSIVTDLTSPLNIQFIERITDPNVMDLLFREAFAARLAMEWAEQLTRTTTTQQMMASLYAEKLGNAKSTDGQEGTREQISDSSWISVRW